jgi:predicted nucleic-acid-binding Zn-ribbon protein
MKQPQLCVKCGSEELYTATIYAGGGHGSLLPVGTLHGPKYENIVCSDCGFTEWYAQKADLYLVKEKLKRIGAAD